MRVAVVTDIHGNRAALFAVLNDLQGQAPDQIVFGGDAALFGSHPRECWQRVLDLGWPRVQGNTDRYIADPATKLATFGPDQAEQAEFLRRNIAWAERQLGDSLVAELRRMSHRAVVTSRAGTVLIVHGAPGDDETGLSRADSDEDLAANVGRIDAEVLVCGHTHTAFVRHVGDALLVNCGSVGRTHDGLPGQATYAVLDDSAGRWSATIRRVPYGHESAHRELLARQVPISEQFAATLLTGRSPS